MTKEDVLASFEVAWLNPATAKDGSVLADELERRAAVFVVSDRTGLVDAVRDWLESKNEVRVIHAVALIQEFRLVELLEPIKTVRASVVSGAFGHRSSIWLFDRAIESLK